VNYLTFTAGIDCYFLHKENSSFIYYTALTSIALSIGYNHYSMVITFAVFMRKGGINNGL